METENQFCYKLIYFTKKDLGPGFVQTVTIHPCKKSNPLVLARRERRPSDILWIGVTESGCNHLNSHEQNHQEGEAKDSNVAHTRSALSV